MFSLHAIRSRLPRRCIAATSVRTYASQTPGNPMLEVFNRKTKHLQKDRAARNVEESRKVDYLKDEVALRLCERLLVRNPTKQGGSERLRKQTLTRLCFAYRTSNATFRTCSTWAQTAATLRGR